MLASEEASLEDEGWGSAEGGDSKGANQKMDLDRIVARPIKITLADAATDHHDIKLGKFSLIWREDDECANDFIVEFVSSSSAWIQEGLPGVADSWIVIFNGSRFDIFTVDGMQLHLTQEKAILCDEIDQCGIPSFDISLKGGRFIAKNCKLSQECTILQKGLARENSGCVEVEFSGVESRLSLSQIGMRFVPSFLFLCPSSFSTGFELDLVNGYIEQVPFDAVPVTSRGMQSCFLISFTADSMTMQISTVRFRST
jgi:hypothetical protein